MHAIENLLRAPLRHFKAVTQGLVLALELGGTRARDGLDPGTRRGRAFHPALRRAHRDALAGGNADPLSSLAPRERQIAAHVGRGLRNKEIAEALAMSEGTVKVYLHTIYQKLGIKNRTELALIAHKAGEAGPNFS